MPGRAHVLSRPACEPLHLLAAQSGDELAMVFAHGGFLHVRQVGVLSQVHGPQHSADLGEDRRSSHPGNRRRNNKTRAPHLARGLVTTFTRILYLPLLR
jgi:hypothetical protein